MTTVYRIQQGLRALFAFAYPVEEVEAEAILTPAEIALFHQLSRSEKLHSINVLRDVLTQASSTPHALQASALLHDIGKVRYPLAVWQKTLAVIVGKFAPEWVQRYSADDERSFWRAPFTVRRHHPRWGGELLSQINSDECVIWLVTHHADPADQHINHPWHALLVRLQRADDLN